MTARRSKPQPVMMPAKVVKAEEDLLMQSWLASNSEPRKVGAVIRKIECKFLQTKVILVRSSFYVQLFDRMPVGNTLGHSLSGAARGELHAHRIPAAHLGKESGTQIGVPSCCGVITIDSRTVDSLLPPANVKRNHTHIH